jgi:hypothetical protein
MRIKVISDSRRDGIYNHVCMSFDELCVVCSSGGTNLLPHRLAFVLHRCIVWLQISAPQARHTVRAGSEIELKPATSASSESYEVEKI